MGKFVSSPILTLLVFIALSLNMSRERWLNDSKVFPEIEREFPRCLGRNHTEMMMMVLHVLRIEAKASRRVEFVKIKSRGNEILSTLFLEMSENN